MATQQELCLRISLLHSTERFRPFISYQTKSAMGEVEHCRVVGNSDGVCTLFGASGETITFTWLHARLRNAARDPAGESGEICTVID